MFAHWPKPFGDDFKPTTAQRTRRAFVDAKYEWSRAAATWARVQHSVEQKGEVHPQGERPVVAQEADVISSCSTPNRSTLIRILRRRRNSFSSH